MKENNQIVDFHNTINNKLQGQFNIYQKKMIKNKKLREENEKKHKYGNIIKYDENSNIINDENDNKEGNKDEKFTYITNDIMNEITHFYFNTYDNKYSNVDTNEMRLKWFQTNFDNGSFLFKTLLINNLKMYQETHNIENLETEIAIIKEKHIMMSNNASMVEPHLQRQQSVDLSNQKIKTTTPTIIKYPTLERLELDNGKVAIDSDGNIIMIGDYALVDVNNTKALYKREVIGTMDMWIKEDISKLYKLIQDKKNNCISNPELNLEDESFYDFDMDKLKCVSKDAMVTSIDNLTEHHKVELQINDLQRELDYIQNIPVLIATINKEMINDRMFLITKVNNMKKHMKEKEDEIKLEEEKIKASLQTVKPCIHNQLLNKFYTIDNDYEKYMFGDTILKQFENNDYKYFNSNKDNLDNLDNLNNLDRVNNIDKHNNKYTTDETHTINDYNKFNIVNNDKNYTFCNLCDQRLLCNHYKLIISYFNKIRHNNETMDKIDYNKVINIYAIEDNGTYICNSCGYSIGNTEQLDIDEFVKGDDGGAIKIREVDKQIPIIEKDKEYINNVINTLYENDDSNKNNLMQRISIFNLMKQLCNLDMLTIKDEVEMLNFLKSYSFEKKENFARTIQKQVGNIKLDLLKKLIDSAYLNYLLSDIGARFLITLQTSSKNYKLINKFNNKNDVNSTYCNNTNIIGYPLINNSDEKDGIHYIMCLFSQMALISDYKCLNDKSFNEIKFIERLKKQVDNDNMVKDKITIALHEKSSIIENINEFDTHYTNYWRDYKPRLEYSIITWHPDKILNNANLKELNHNNSDKMLNVGKENSIYYSLTIMNKINDIIHNSVHSNKPMLLNNCCPEQYNEKQTFNYMTYFEKLNSDIPKNISLLEEVTIILSKIKNIYEQNKINIIYEPLYKPSQHILKLQFNITQDEIKDMYLKYIENGIHIGKEHIYDKYGRCILSNIKKSDIEKQSYSLQDYKRLQVSIQSGNTLINKTEESNDTIFSLIEQSEMKKIDELIENIPNLDVLKYLKNFLIKIKESETDIFDGFNTTAKPQTYRKTEKFDIYKHLRNLTDTIINEIENLVKKIISSDKNIYKYKKIMANLGDFKHLYDDYKIVNNNIEDIDIDKYAELFRYTKQEEYLQFSIKFLNDVMNQIKHNKLSNPLNKSEIRPQYRDFLRFGEKNNLFKVLNESSREIFNFSKLIKSKQNYKVLFPELVCNIIHYLNIISLSNLFNSLNTNKLTNVESELIDYDFQMSEEPNNDLKELNKELQLGLDEDSILDTEEEVNFIESIEIQNSDNLKIVYEFIITYLDYIKSNQNTYDILSETYIKHEITRFDQKKIERTLKQYKILKEEQNEELRMVLYLQMHVQKNLKLENFADTVENMLNNNMYNSSQDSVDNYEEVPEYNDDYVPNETTEKSEEYMGTVISGDNDVGDQDYDMIAVDDD